jgi:hypothetical protein
MDTCYWEERRGVSKRVNDLRILFPPSLIYWRGYVFIYSLGKAWNYK